jgi:hypothetical protein
MVCGKCKLDLEPDGGHTQCYGCGNRFHYACSVSYNTWRAKSQAMKEEWRCEACRKNGHNPPVTPSSNVRGESGSGGVEVIATDNVVTLQSLQKSLDTFAKDHKNNCKSLFSTIDKNFKDYLNKVAKTIENQFESHVQSLQQKIDLLSQDNAHLKSELSTAKEKLCTLELKMANICHSNSTPPIQRNDNANATCSAQVQSQSRSARNFSQVLQSQPTGVGLRSPSLSQPPNVGIRSPSISQPPNPTRIRKQTSASSFSSFPQVLPAAVGSTPGDNSCNPEEWVTVTRRQPNKVRVVPKIGQKQANPSSALMVKPKVSRPRTSALFVTRFTPTVTSQNIMEFLKSSVQLSHLKISKIKTRHQDLYASFHVEVLSDEFGKIDDVSVWPDGCLIKTYLGRLLPDIVVPEAPPGVDTDEL